MVKGGQPALYLPKPGCYRCSLAVGHNLADRSMFTSPVSLRNTGRPIHQHFDPSTLRESCFCPMANIKSQIKRNRQNEVRAARNKAAKSELKTRIKAVTTADAGDDVGELYRSAQKRIDMAVTKGLMHPNTAARRKSRLAKKVG
jgi:small subunit ribosomal protein S20